MKRNPDVLKRFPGDDEVGTTATEETVTGDGTGEALAAVEGE